MERILRRYFVLVPVLLATVSTYYLMSAASAVTGALIFPVSSSALLSLGVPKPVPAASTAPSRNLSGKFILSKNIFDSITGPIIDAPPAPPPPASQSDDSQGGFFQKCAQGPRVEITFVDTDHPKWSFATFSLNETDKEHPMVRQGGTVAGKEVFMIFRERVFFKENGNICYIAMFEPPPPPPAPSASAAPAPSGPPGGPDKVPDNIAKGIQKVDDTHFNIDRLTKEQIIAHSTDFMKTTRIQPMSDAAGKTLGIQLNNIRPDTLMGMLGLQNGDLLQSINGFEMTSPEKALEAYAKLGAAPQIQVAVVRNGKPTTLEFNIK